MADEQNGDYTREPAHRIFAQELLESTLSYKEGDSTYAPTYTITPTGAKINRVALTGILYDKEDIGNDSEYWMGKVADITETIRIYAGQYQPEAAEFLSNIVLPAIITVVGKPSMYEKEDGSIYVSIRPEWISEVSEDARKKWVLEAAAELAGRLTEMKNTNTTCKEIREATTHYGSNGKEWAAMGLKAIAEING
jgi:RPA family protein